MDNKMFSHIRKILDEFEDVCVKGSNSGLFTKEEEYIIDYFELNLSKALMQDIFDNGEKVAKIILAAKGLTDVNVKVK